MTDCTNCHSTLAENSKFCGQCGQSTKSFRRPFVSFFRESLHELMDIDGRLFVTLKTLLVKPGLAAFEFEQGKRTKYTPPLRLYLVFSLVFFLVLSSFQHLYSKDGSGTESTTELYSRIMFVLFPVFAFYIGCLFRKSYFITNLVFSMHMHTVAYIALIVIGPLEALEDKHQIFVWLQAVPTVYLVWYMFSAFKTMYRESWWLTVLKGLAIYLVYMMTLGFVFDVVLT